MPRVFHCDDEPNYRSLVRVVLARADQGYEVVGEAADGREALEKAPALRPDVVLLDINMPGMGGIEALPELRKALPDAKIIALTTSWRSSWAEPWERLGGDAFVEKPRNAMALPELLDAALAQTDVDPLDVAESVFDRWRSGEREEAWGLFAPEAVVHPLTADRPLEGVAAARAWFEAQPPPVQNGRSRIMKMLALHDTVLIEGMVEIGEDRFPAAWVLRIRDGVIHESRAFRTWAEAQEAAGLSGAVTPTAERSSGTSAAWVLATARRVLGGGPSPATA